MKYTEINGLRQEIGVCGCPDNTSLIVGETCEECHQTVRSELEPVPMNGFELQAMDVIELMPDITQAEFEELASIVTDLLMEEWANCMEGAVALIQGDRRTVSRIE